MHYRFFGNPCAPSYIMIIAEEKLCKSVHDMFPRKSVGSGEVTVEVSG